MSNPHAAVDAAVDAELQPLRVALTAARAALAAEVAAEANDVVALAAAQSTIADLTAQIAALQKPKPARALFGAAVKGLWTQFLAFFTKTAAEGARVYYQPGVLPTTISGALHDALVANPKLKFVCVSFKPDPVASVAGKYDSWASTIAYALKALTDKGITVLFCLQHEMDNPSKNMDPVAYCGMWNRLIPLVKAANPAVLSAWIPMGYQVLLQGQSYKFRPFAYLVDVIMPDIYSHGASVVDICDPVFAVLDGWYPGKPHGLGEFGVLASDVANRGKWVIDGLNNAGLTYACYFNLQNGDATAPDWSLSDADLTAIAGAL